MAPFRRVATRCAIVNLRRSLDPLGGRSMIFAGCSRVANFGIKQVPRIRNDLVGRDFAKIDGGTCPNRMSPCTLRVVHGCGPLHGQDSTSSSMPFPYTTTRFCSPCFASLCMHVTRSCVSSRMSDFRSRPRYVTGENLRCTLDSVAERLPKTPAAARMPSPDIARAVAVRLATLVSNFSP